MLSTVMGKFNHPAWTMPQVFGLELGRLLAAVTTSVLLCLTGCGAAQPADDEAEAPAAPTRPRLYSRADAFRDPATAAQMAHREPGTEWVHIPVRLIFQDHDAELDDGDRAILDAFHENLTGRTDVLRLLVGGHAEAGPDERASHRLSRQRAIVVVSYLVDELGLSRELFEVVGRGSCCPATCGPEGCGADNERVEFWVLTESRSTDEAR